MLYTTRDAPVYYGETTFIGGIPGIGFEPRKRSMKREQNIFKWNIDDPTSYTFYVRRLRKILYDATNTDEDYGYGACALTKNTSFGYDIGTPCIMLRINKLFGYYPERPTYDLFANISLDFESINICGQTSNRTICCNDDRMLFHCISMV
ncbi:hypothetical protein DINM_001135 [Dirofilaria immitis]|nr:hypothetical protein [Dirofilaria immitis]